MEIVTFHYEERENNLYNQILGIWEEVEQAEKVKTCIEPLQEQEKRTITGKTERVRPIKNKSEIFIT